MRYWLRRYSDNILGGLPANRLLALDVFRGLTITAMVLVNNPGSWSYVYSPMLHATWHGWTPTDLIFPFFVFIVGVSVSIVMNRELYKGTNKLLLMKNAAIRGAKLFALGLFLALFFYNFRDPNFSWIDDKLLSIRVMGVLQRLGLVFLFTVVIVLYFKPKGRLLWALGLLLGYWACLSWLPYTGADGQVYVGQLDFGNNLTAYVDDWLLAAKHLYYGKAQPFAFDPEGVLSTFPAISGALFGVFVGDFLTSEKYDLVTKSRNLIMAGIGMLALGQIWDLVLPINKSIWTSSFVVLSTGWACFILGVLIWVLDIKSYKRWSAPFVVFGANAIAFYMFSAVLARILLMVPVADSSVKGFVYQDMLQPVFGNYNGSLAFAILYCLLCYAVMHWFYVKRWFFKV